MANVMFLVHFLEENIRPLREVISIFWQNVNEIVIEYFYDKKFPQLVSN